MASPATAILQSSSGPKRRLRSLALSARFKNEALGMSDYEILSRATAFLLSVDPPDPVSSSSSTYSDHLVQSENKRRSLLHKQDYSYPPAGGPTRPAEALRWLEFCPGKFRPLVHVVASSHVLSPWLWKKYYQQPWLETVQQHHVTYAVDVIEPSSRNVLATFPLNASPIHHPAGIDLAIAHLKDEDTALQRLNDLGVGIHHLVDDNESSFAKGLEVHFDGYQVSEDEHVRKSTLLLDTSLDASIHDKHQNQTGEDDTRIFIPYTATGSLIYASPTRFLASTDQPLPEGLCGGPVLDKDDTHILGVVEGIVPKDHLDSRIAGAAAFIPSFAVQEFIDYSERIILQRILPKTLYDGVVEIKRGKGLNDSSQQSIQFNGDVAGRSGKDEISNQLDRMYNEFTDKMKQVLTPEQVEAVLATVERERQEVLDILQRDGGDVDTIVEQVRQRTREYQASLLKELATRTEAEWNTIEEPNHNK
jgi:hypothetical protein